MNEPSNPSSPPDPRTEAAPAKTEKSILGQLREHLFPWKATPSAFQWIGTFLLVLAFAVYFLVGPICLWIAYDNVLTGNASFAGKAGGTHRATRKRSPRDFWIMTVMTGGLGLGLTAFNLYYVYDAFRMDKASRADRRSDGRSKESKPD